MKEDRYHKHRLANHVLHPETLMLGYGYDPLLSEGAVKPPVFLTSTFVFRSAEEGRAVLQRLVHDLGPIEGVTEVSEAQWNPDRTAMLISIQLAKDHDDADHDATAS